MTLALRTLLSSLIALALAMAPLPAVAASATGVIEGVVTGPGGAPLGASDTVEVEARDAVSNGVRGQATVDPESGAYRVEGLADGDYAVTFSYTGSGDLVSEWWGDTYRFAERAIGTVAGGVALTASAQLERGTRLQGTVLGEQTPVAGAWIRLTSVDGFDPYLTDNSVAVTRSDGTYATRWVPAGTYAVEVDPRSDAWKAPEDRQLALVAGQPHVHDVRLDPWGSISGRVFVRTGEDAAGTRANINVYVQDPVTGQWVWPGWNHWTASDGTFTIDGLRAREYRLEFEPDGAFAGFFGGASTVAGATSIVVADGQQVTGIDVEFDAEGRLQAEVTFRSAPGAEPQAVGGAEVELWRLDDEEGVYLPVASTSAAGDGLWYSPHLHGGTYIVQFRADPYSGIGAGYYADARYFYESTEIVLAVGEKLDLGRIILEPRYFDVARIAGIDRFSTSVEISRLLHPEGRAPVVYLANGRKFPDALAAGPAASRSGGVILSTEATGLPAAVAEELSRLDPLRVVVLGDENTISEGVETAVGALLSPDAEIERFAGAGRYETGEMIVRDAFAEYGAGQAIIATGANYPDALAAGPASAQVGGPVILVDGGARGLDDRTRGLIDQLGITEVFIAGGPSTVSPGIQSDLDGLLGAAHVVRLAGIDRYETAAIINEAFFGTSDHALLATGTGFADALTGGPLAAALGSPLYLSSPSCIPAVAADGILRRQAAGIWLLGGTPTLGIPVEELALC